MSEQSLVFLDLETTGLDPVTDLVVEIGALHVSNDLRDVREEFHVVVDDPRAFALMGREVRDMHAASGLVLDMLGRDTLYPTEAWYTLDTWLNEVSVCQRHSVMLCGDSVHFDRSFLAMSDRAPGSQADLFRRSICERLHHRMLDVSAFRVARELWGVEPCPPVAELGILGGRTLVEHRALPDCYASLAKARWHLGRLT